MAQHCENCDGTFTHEVRYCPDCGDAVDLDATLDDRTATRDQGFMEKHWIKVLVLTAILLLPTLPGLAASGNLGGAIGFLTGAGLAALFISSGIVFAGDFLYRAVT